MRGSSLTLARFACEGQSSRGRWLVRELPGVALMRHRSGRWKIHVGLAIITHNQISQRRVWGERWVAESDRRFMRLGCRKYRTLDEALHELELTAASEDAVSQLSEVL